MNKLAPGIVATLCYAVATALITAGTYLNAGLPSALILAGVALAVYVPLYIIAHAD